MGIFSKLFGRKGQQNTGASTPTGGGRFRELFEQLKPELNLTADQEIKIKEIFREFRQERREVKQSGGGAAEIKESRQEAKQKIREILNPDQLAILRDKMGS
jgi:Spy/CpxP family protein refolding chaperone